MVLLINGASNGHPAKDRVKKPTVCFGCGEIGHVKRNCPKEMAENDSISPTDDKGKDSKSKTCYN